MIAFQHIVVPTDFGDTAERALDVAIALASKFGSRITLLHVSWLPAPVYAAYAQGLTWPTEEMELGAKKELAEVIAKAKERYPNIDCTVVTGEPWQTILDVAKKRDADLIVMGTHGRRGLPRVLLGSVAERIVRLSPVPVLTVSCRDEPARHEK